jgi:hypothetical protein
VVQQTARRGVGAAHLLPAGTATAAAGHNFAKVEAGRQDTAGYFLQPGMFDACIHLAPVPAAGAPIAVTRVPVAASALLLHAADDVCKHSGWAVAASLRIDPADHSALNDMHWCSGSSYGTSSGMHLSGLLAKAMAAPAAAADALSAAGSELLYAVEWQARSPGGTAHSIRLAGGAAPLWHLGSRNAAVAGQQFSHSDAAFAASHLAVMQQVSVECTWAG